MDLDPRNDPNKPATCRLAADPARWDDTQARTIRPTAFFLSHTMGEIGLALAEESDGPADPHAGPIRLSQCILLNPFVAKRLMLALRAWVNHHESRYGPIHEPVQPPPSGRPAGWGASEPADHGQDPADELARRVQRLGVTVGCERSFKISSNGLLTNRFLRGVSLNAIGPNAHAKVEQVCKDLAMPANLLAAFNAAIGLADYVHFGFEQEGQRCLYKVYLEFFETIAQTGNALAQDQGPHLMHLGFKWDKAEPHRQALTNYHWLAFLPVDQIHRNMAAILEGRQRRVPLEIARGIVDLAARRIAARDIVYLRVTEAGLPRAISRGTRRCLPSRIAAMLRWI